MQISALCLGNFALLILLFFLRCVQQEFLRSLKKKFHFYIFAFFCHHFAIFLVCFCFGGTTRFCAFFFALCSSSAERRNLALRKENRAAHNKQTENEREDEGKGARCPPHRSPPRLREPERRATALTPATTSSPRLDSVASRRQR